MVRVIFGKRGTGKTKTMIALVNTAVTQEAGNVVCIERGQNLRYNIKISAKLIDMTEFSEAAKGFEELYCFICGLYSGNYDITHVFIDNLYRVTGCADSAAAVEFLHKLEHFSAHKNIGFTITISDAIENMPPEMEQYHYPVADMDGHDRATLFEN